MAQQIGIMKAVGGVRGQIMGMYFDDFRISNRIFAIEVAIGLLVPALAALYPIISGTRVTVRDYKFSVTGVFIWLAIIILISTLASLLPAYKAARLSVREILSYE
ncbi:MAG: hypothetical protein QME41_02720 [Actinomycetota bacterium]|nr:hypothetical protein [Actinomycetota bacterium]